MSGISKQTKIFTVIGVVTTILGYLFLMYKGYNLNKEIADKKTEIEQLDAIRQEKITQLKDIENKLLQITLSSQDTLTIKQGEKLANEIGIPTGKYYRVTTAKDTSIKNAEMYEKMGFEYLLAKDIDKAIEAFIKSENSYNGYHQVYEISRFLMKNKKKLTADNPDKWNNTYQTILTKYSWKMPEKHKLMLLEKAK